MNVDRLSYGVGAHPSPHGVGGFLDQRCGVGTNDVAAQNLAARRFCQNFHKTVFVFYGRSVGGV